MALSKNGRAFFYSLFVIEVDGKGHNNQPERKEYDEVQDFETKELGLKVPKFRNEEVLGDVEYVMNAIERGLEG